MSILFESRPKEVEELDKIKLKVNIPFINHFIDVNEFYKILEHIIENKKLRNDIINEIYNVVKSYGNSNKEMIIRFIKEIPKNNYKMRLEVLYRNKENIIEVNGIYYIKIHKLNMVVTPLLVIDDEEKSKLEKRISDFLLKNKINTNLAKGIVERCEFLIKNPYGSREPIGNILFTEIPGNYNYRLGYYVDERNKFIVLVGIYKHINGKINPNKPEIKLL
ncbi:hypothetical protein YN1_7010 [Nanoarchaeota archaeon]